MQAQVHEQEAMMATETYPCGVTAEAIEKTRRRIEERIRTERQMQDACTHEEYRPHQLKLGCPRCGKQMRE